MKEQIKELRVKIDGLSQLVKILHGGPKLMIDINTKPKSVSIDEWLQCFDKTNILFVDSFGSSKELVQSGELAKCYDSLILAKAWLGKVLGELGEPTPYANDGKRTDVNSIEPTADTSDDSRDAYSSVIDWSSANHIEKVDWLRQEIQHITYVVYQICVTNSKTRFHSETCYRHLCEARFWLGFELGRIKESGTTGSNI